MAMRKDDRSVKLDENIGITSVPFLVSPVSSGIATAGSTLAWWNAPASETMIKGTGYTGNVTMWILTGAVIIFLLAYRNRQTRAPLFRAIRWWAVLSGWFLDQVLANVIFRALLNQPTFVPYLLPVASSAIGRTVAAGLARREPVRHALFTFVVDMVVTSAVWSVVPLPFGPAHVILRFCACSCAAAFGGSLWYKSIQGEADRS